MYYLCFDGKPLDLSKISFFDGVKSTDIINIINYYNSFENVSLLINEIKNNRLIANGADIKRIDICQKEKVKGVVMYKIVPYTRTLLTSNTKKYFNIQFLYSYIVNHLNDKLFIAWLSGKYGNRAYTKNFIAELNSYVNNPYSFSNSEEDELLLDIERFVYSECYTSKKMDKIHGRGLADLGLLIMAYDNRVYYEQKKLSKKDNNAIADNYDTEEFLEPDDYLYFNPGATSLVFKEAKERAKVLSLNKSNVN